MRKIKVRGLVIEPLVSGEKWITSDEEYHEVYLNYVECSAYINGHAVVWESVSEYTGLKDKNGKEIFEGDILQASFDEMPVFVKYSIDEAAFVFVDNFSRFGPEEYKVDDLHYEAYEIIGNIYNNPELLGDSK